MPSARIDRPTRLVLRERSPAQRCERAAKTPGRRAGVPPWRRSASRSFQTGHRAGRRASANDWKDRGLGERRQATALSRRLPARRVPRTRRAHPRLLEGAPHLREEPRPARGRAALRLLRRPARRPTARPGAHHVLSRVFKDIFPRYKTMRGFKVPRKAGWDTHGLPVELEIERRLGINGKKEIEDYGIVEFNRLCKESVLTYLEEWDRLTERIGFWIDLGDAYYTFTNEYIETRVVAAAPDLGQGPPLPGVQGRALLPPLRHGDLEPRGVAGLPGGRRAERLRALPAARGGRRAARGRSGWRRRRGRERATSLLVWTTTPWTLISNVAAAVHPDIEYALAESRGERFVLAADLVEPVLRQGRPHPAARSPAADSSGWATSRRTASSTPDKPAFVVIAGDYVTTTEGTGIVHIAPAFGEDDMRVGIENDLPVLNPVDGEGRFAAEVTPWAGRLRQGRRPAHHRRPAPARAARRRGPLHAQLPVLLALRHAAPLLLEVDLVHPHHGRQGRAAGGQRRRHLVPGAHQATAASASGSRTTSTGPCRATATGARRCRSGAATRGTRTASAASPSCASWRSRRRPTTSTCTAPSSTRSSCAARSAAARCAACPRSSTPGSTRAPCPTRSGTTRSRTTDTFEARFPADFICEAIDQTRGWFYSLLAEGTLLFGESSFRTRPLPGPHPRRRGPEDEQEPRQRGRARRRCSTARGPTPSAGTCSPSRAPGTCAASRPRWSTRWCASSSSRCGTPTASSPSTPTSTASIPTAEPVPVAERALLDRWILGELNRLVARRDDRARGLRRRRPPGRAIQQFVDDLSQLVRAPQPAALLEERPRPRQAGRLPHALRVPGHAGQAAGAVHALRRRGALPEPRALGRRGGARERAPLRLAGRRRAI